MPRPPWPALPSPVNAVRRLSEYATPLCSGVHCRARPRGQVRLHAYDRRSDHPGGTDHGGLARSGDFHGFGPHHSW
ncbi:hypothetical protein C791_2299 [Amycolatopsis azurea DSM 43854]|uniref:Uncharacterized protein n=1 Tax=Amycolatopsis azurea DSM 43854 TaxID=1238180 RepID=M2QN90_9PSEU|nr:hypothetical protein C791_2299 [Amycolatopsis azurea DSM 43854]